jgi:hypothetical protein
MGKVRFFEIPLEVLVMRNVYIMLLIFLSFTTLATGCASNFRHEYIMKGQVVDMPTEDSLVVCIGTNDGAEVGQVLDVYRYTYDPAIAEGGGENPIQSSHTGRVIIEQIFNEHFARAKILEGDIEKYDTVQLNKS